MNDKVAEKAEYRGMEGNAVRGWAATRSNLEYGAKLGDGRTNNSTYKVVYKLVEHRRAHNEEKDCEH